ncbi:MAG: transposase family protein [Clostridiales bacterium]|jgi:hypothetical protein|nr:transposase family protein [Clostridiales bacterium]
MFGQIGKAIDACSASITLVSGFDEQALASFAPSHKSVLGYAPNFGLLAQANAMLAWHPQHALLSLMPWLAQASAHRYISKEWSQMNQRNKPCHCGRPRLTNAYFGLPRALGAMAPEAATALRTAINNEATGAEAQALDEFTTRMMEYAEKFIRDPRSFGNVKYNIHEMLVLGALAELDGAVSLSGVRNFGLSNLPWLRGFIQLKDGIPSLMGMKSIYTRFDPIFISREIQLFYSRTWNPVFCQMAMQSANNA